MAHSQQAITPAASLQLARQFAAKARFDEFLLLVEQLRQQCWGNATDLQEIANLCAAFGFLEPARECYERTRELRPEDLGVLVNISNLERAAGRHSEARQIS